MFRYCCVILLIGYLEVLIPTCAINETPCGNVPGWMVTSPATKLIHEYAAVHERLSDLEAYRHANNLRTRYSCCNFKGKCSFTVQNLGDRLCTLETNCEEADSGELKILRTHSKGWNSFPYCHYFPETGCTRTTIKLCHDTFACMTVSKGKIDLLDCLDKRVGPMLDHAGFFSTELFPYQELWYKVSDGLTKMYKFELTRDGEISKSSKPFTTWEELLAF